MAGTDSATPALDALPPEGNVGFGFSYRHAWKAVAVTLAALLVELALLQLFAIGATTGIYHLAPLLDVGSPRGFRDWLSIMQVVSATLTLPGGAAIVLSTWLAARWARMAEQQRADAAEQKLSVMTAEANKWQETAVDAQAKLAAMQAESERRRRPRRRLRR